MIWIKPITHIWYVKTGAKLLILSRETCGSQYYKSSKSVI